jgi:hypothetical protein
MEKDNSELEEIMYLRKELEFYKQSYIDTKKELNELHNEIFELKGE